MLNHIAEVFSLRFAGFRVASRKQCWWTLAMKKALRN